MLSVDTIAINAMFQIIATIATIATIAVIVIRPSIKPRDCFAAAFGSIDAFRPCEFTDCRNCH